LKYAARFRGRVAKQPPLPWQPICCPLVGVGPHVTTKVKRTKLWHILVVRIIC